jgi:A/G-specific adenine glycosylase
MSLQISEMDLVRFRKSLLKWNSSSNKRELPWKGAKNPYYIWLSEVILQQTRVEQGLSYYLKFIKAYPTIHNLACAKDEEVFKMWEGLGYYNRCRNLLASARFIAFECNSKFPETYEGLLALKGIGPYTAAAISSFAFNLPHAVVDGNVYRVLARYFGVDLPSDGTEGKKFFQELATATLDASKPAVYNQAIMDFGATVCKPQLPLCGVCALQSSCKAFDAGIVDKLPVKKKRIERKKRYFNYFVFDSNNEILIHQRSEVDIWKDLFEFFLIETDQPMHWDELTISEVLTKNLGISSFRILSQSFKVRQHLTHRTVESQFIRIGINKIPKVLAQMIRVQKNELNKYAFPKTIQDYLTDFLKLA